MFRKNEISLNRVRDHIVINENGEKLNLYVDSDPMKMVIGLDQAQNALKALSDESSEEEVKSAALFFARVLFGEEQAKELFEFYHGDPSCVINISAKCFSQRIRKKIEKAQKKIK